MTTNHCPICEANAKEINELKKLVAKQAEDKSLWMAQKNFTESKNKLVIYENRITEAHLRQALRELHERVEKL